MPWRGGPSGGALHAATMDSWPRKMDGTHNPLEKMISFAHVKLHVGPQP